MPQDTDASARAIDDVIARAVRELDLEDKVELLTGAAVSPCTARGHRATSDDLQRRADRRSRQRVRRRPTGRAVSQRDAAGPDLGRDRRAAGRRAARRGRPLAQDVHVVLGPTVNLHRTPLGGRLFEAYAEDPLLSGRLAAAYIRGIQRYGVGGLRQALRRQRVRDRTAHRDSRVCEAALARALPAAVRDLRGRRAPWTIMAAYNDVNGVAATEHDELNNGVLKSEWGWDGLLMSDWGATKTAAPAANGGLDLVMPGPRGPWGDQLVAAVRVRRGQRGDDR